MKTWLIGVLMAVAMPVLAAEPIVGNWKTASGETVEAARCDKQFCLTLKTGEYVGKQIGVLVGDSIHYKGNVTDPKENKTYTGSAVVTSNLTSPDTLKLKGCVLKLLCKTQEWERMSAK